MLSEFSPGFCVGHRIFLGLCLILTSILFVPRKRYSPVWVKYGRFSLGSSILDFHWVFSWVGFHQVCIIIESNNWCFCWFCYHLTLLLFCFNRTIESVNGKWHLWEEVPSAQNLSRHKKPHNDLTKPCEMCKEVYDVKEWTMIRGIQLCPKKPTAIAVA